MATLDDVLEDTMLFSAARAPFPRPTAHAAPFTPRAQIYAPPTMPSAAVDDGDAHIWSWRLGDTPATVADVDCLVTAMHGGITMRVCDRIEFGHVRLTTLEDREIPLPLTTEFLVWAYYIYNGAIAAGASPLYPLAAKVDPSLMHVFAYEFPLDGGAMRKPDEAALARETFMPPGPSAAEPLTVGPEERNRLVVAPFRVVVVASLVCGKGRADFEPGEILFAGRLNPHLMLIANRELKEVSGAVTIERPAASSHAMAGMNSEIEAALYRDNNDPDNTLYIGPPKPLWRNLFDDLLVGWSAPAFVMVRPDITPATITDAVRVTETTGGLIRSYALSPSLRDVRRTARQGAFDNVHLAPTHTNGPHAVPGIPGLDKIYMAPFCEHDCLHTHWRWGSYNTKAHHKGWAAPSPAWRPSAGNRAPGAPNTTAGAPMAPDNQTIVIAPVNIHAFRYYFTATGRSAAQPALPIPSGSWTIAFHHGSAYSLKTVGFLAPTYAKLRQSPGWSTPTLPSTGALTDSGRMYWGLRYTGYTDGAGRHHAAEQLEAVKISDLRTP